MNGNYTTIDPPMFENIPAELKEYYQWVAWKAAPRPNGKFAKVPVSPMTGANASTKDPTTWGTYDQAVTFYNSGGIAGIGFVFTDNDPFCGIDLDDCWDPHDGHLADWAQEIIYNLDSYAEVSPSGTGVKVFAKGQLNGPGRNFGNVEIYNTKRFFTVTGDMIPDCPGDVLDRTDQINKLVENGDNVSNDETYQNADLDVLVVPLGTKKLIREGEPVGDRSEAMMSVINSLVHAKVPEHKIVSIFDEYQIGEKYREKGPGKKEWLTGQINKAREFVADKSQTDSGGTDSVIEELNQKHAVIMLGGKCCILNETVDPVFNRPEITFSSMGDFTYRYANRNGIAKRWIESAARRQYEGIVFSPGEEVPGYYNLFRGFSVEPEPGDWSLFRDHILLVIADGNQDAHDYIIAWIADLFQNPGGRRPGTAIVLRGKQGTGKGVFVSQIGHVLSSHFLHITNQRQITGRFNNHLKDALLVFCDEAIWAGNKSDEGVLKAMITEDSFQIEPKGKDPFTVENHIRLIAASNNDWVVPAGNSDRRFFVLDVSDIHIQDPSYFVPIIDQMDHGGREAMLYDLLQYDLGGIDFGKFPHTQARLDQIIASMSSVQKFWLDKLHEGILKKYSDDGEWENIETTDLYTQYTDQAKSMGDRYPLSAIQFGKELSNICPGKERKRLTTPYGRDWHYVFPDLETCRKAFEDFVGQEIPWE